MSYKSRYTVCGKTWGPTSPGAKGLTHVPANYSKSLGCSQGGINFRGRLRSINSRCIIYSRLTEKGNKFKPMALPITVITPSDAHLDGNKSARIRR